MHLSLVIPAKERIKLQYKLQVQEKE